MTDTSQLVEDYQRDGIVLLRGYLQPEQVAEIRAELDRYVREDLASKPADARTLEADGQNIRNLWRLELHSPRLRQMVERPELVELVGQMVRGEALLMAIETFNKPAQVGSAVPYHQDNAYFCQAPPDMLTVWIAMDPVTPENGPVYFIRGSHQAGVLRTRPSGIRGNSIGLAEPPSTPLSEQFCATLAPGDATIHHCQTIHHSGPNRSGQPRLGLLLVYRGTHTKTDPALKAIYTEAVTAMPPA